MPYFVVLLKGGSESYLIHTSRCRYVNGYTLLHNRNGEVTRRVPDSDLECPVQEVWLDGHSETEGMNSRT